MSQNIIDTTYFRVGEYIVFTINKNEYCIALFDSYALQWQNCNIDVTKTQNQLDDEFAG